MGRYKALRSFGANLLVDEPFDDILLRVQGKKFVSREEGEYIMRRMALRSRLRTEEYSREEVWKIYAFQQVYRQRMYFLSQSRHRYMNVLYKGVIYPLLELPSPDVFRQKKLPEVSKDGNIEPVWVNLSADDIRSSSFGNQGMKRISRRKIIFPEVLATCCYTCSSFVTKDSAWCVRHLVSLPDGRPCYERFNLRIVCLRCHLEMGTKSPAKFAMGRGSYRCMKGLAAKEYIITFGHAFDIYYALYRGIKHEK